MIITIEGPTGAGKTAIALELARALGSQIINCDSRQVYKYMDIGTAKPTAAELQEVPHHLIDIIEPDQAYNAGLFAKDAARLIEDLQGEGICPIFCGGTGLYVKALLEGLFEHPPIDPSLRAKLRQELKERGIAALYEELRELDPEFAARISTKDPQRILRGLEIYRATGQTMSRHWALQKREPRYSAFKILVNLPRKTLYQRINSRMDQMLERGLLPEIQGLLEMGFTWTDPGMNSLGYKEFRDHFEKGSDPQDCAAIAAQGHRNYAKRQLTWYRKQRFDLTCDPESFSLSDILKALKA